MIREFMRQSMFNNPSNKEKTGALEFLFEHSAPRKEFFIMVILSVLMATLGLLTDNSTVIVGSMLIAPILYPILGLAMGIVMRDISLIFKSFLTLLKAIILVMAVATFVTVVFSAQINGLTAEILARTQLSWLDAAIGTVAGFAAAFAISKPNISETLPGVAISVALVPPLAVTGIGLAKHDTPMLLNSLLLFSVNAVGVIVAAAIVFALMNFAGTRNVAEELVKKEEEKIAKEK